MKNNKCHLLEDSVLESELVPTSVKFFCLKTYVDESHLFRYLLSCKNCGQLFFFEFYEEIDWKEGKDPQYTTYIPVESKKDADKINNKSQIELLGIRPRLQVDLVGDKRTIRWIK